MERRLTYRWKEDGLYIVLNDNVEIERFGPIEYVKDLIEVMIKAVEHKEKKIKCRKKKRGDKNQ